MCVAACPPEGLQVGLHAESRAPRDRSVDRTPFHRSLQYLMHFWERMGVYVCCWFWSSKVVCNDSRQPQAQRHCRALPHNGLFLAWARGWQPEEELGRQPRRCQRLDRALSFTQIHIEYM